MNSVRINPLYPGNTTQNPRNTVKTLVQNAKNHQGYLFSFFYTEKVYLYTYV